MSLFGGFFDTKSSPSVGGNQQSEETEKKSGGKTRRVDKYGTRRKVWNGTAEMTNGGLRKDDLIKNTKGRIVSVKRHSTMKQRYAKTEDS